MRHAHGQPITVTDEVKATRRMDARLAGYTVDEIDTAAASADRALKLGVDWWGPTWINLLMLIRSGY